MNEKFGGRVVRVSFDTGFECPWGKCIFCRNETFSPKVSVNMQKENWREVVDKSMTFLKNRYKNKFFAAYFQSGTSTFGPAEKLKEFYRAAASLDGVVAFIISTRPDYIDREKIELILEALPPHIDEIWIELGFQSAKESSLEWMKRGHSTDEYFKALDLIKKFGDKKIKVAPHIILGLPGETAEEMVETALKSINHPVVKGLKPHHLQVHKGTVLEKIYEKEPFELLSIDDYVKIMSEIIAVTPEEIVFSRLFTTSPEEYLIAPKWELTTQEALQKLENRLKMTKIRQGCKKLQ